MERTLVVLAIFAGLCCFAAGANVLSKETDTVTLSYPTTAPYPGRRYWFKGTYTATNPPNINDALFRQHSVSGTVTRVTAPAHMPLPSPTTFGLVINPVHMADAGDYSTVTEDRVSFVWYYEVAATLSVWIQPAKPVVSTDPSNLHAGRSVEVTCSVPRLHPGVHEDSFNMTWDGDSICPGSPDCNVTSTPTGSDGAERYTLQFTKTVTKADNGANIVCSIQPPQGDDRFSDLLMLDVKYGPTSRPTIGASNESPELYETVILACDYSGIDANPQISVVLWNFNGDNVYHDQKSHVDAMIITDITEKDNGNYSCLTGNEAGFIQSKTISLKLNVSNEPVWSEKVPEGGTVTLQYDTTVENPWKRYWYRGPYSSASPPNPAQALFRQDNITDGPVTRVTAPSYMTVPYPTTFDLRITEATRTDAGVYTAVTTDQRDRPFYNVGELNIYNVGCGSNGPAILTEPAGDIYSPTVGGSGNYPHNSFCQWRVKYTNGMIPHLDVNSFILEGGPSSCTRDYLEVYDGANNSSQRFGRYCGANKPPNSFTASGSAIFLQFKSDNSVTYSGFYISYSAMDPA